MRILGALLLSVLFAGRAAAADTSIPHLRKQGSATQLVVDGKPLV